MTIRIEVSEQGVVEVYDAQKLLRKWETALNYYNQGSEIASYLIDVIGVAKGEHRFSSDIDHSDVFFYVDHEEVVWWWTSDQGHDFQGAEIADCINQLMTGGVEAAFLDPDAQQSRWCNKKAR